jgi:hypothetical protein
MSTITRHRRHWKGERDAMMIRPDIEVGHAVRERAREAGMTISDFVSMLLAREVDMPERAPSSPPPRADQELPLEEELLTG